MKNRFVRVSVVTIIVSLFYFIIFTEKTIDTPIDVEPELKEKIDSDSKIDTLLNEKGYVVVGKPNTVKLIRVADTVNHKDFHIVGIHNNNAIIAKEEDKDNLQVYVKFSSSSWLNEEVVSVYSGKLADPDFKSNPEAKMFVTRITEGCKQGINFAGHYTLIYWGCGTSCQYGVVVNRKTGEIFDGYQSSLGSEFKKESKRIIINSDMIEDNAQYIPLYQLEKFKLQSWDGVKFTAIN
tara:strand:- start:21814 stop:22524 length:711 start_codon:yes stop_codon:yes gene_type:complete